MPGSLYGINDRGFQQALERRLLIRDDVSLTLSPEASVALDVDVDELRFHLGWRRYAAFSTQAAVAAQFARFRLRNPVGSGIITKVTYASLCSSANYDFCASLSNNTVDLATVVGGASGSAIGTDTRQFGPNNLIGGNCVMSKQTDAVAQTPQLCDLFGLANTVTVEPHLPIYLTPGFCLDLYVQQANTAIPCSLGWQERFMNDQENAP